MMAEKITQPFMRRAVLAATLVRLVGQPCFDRLRGMPLLHRFAGPKATQTPDPVLLAVLAIDRVGPERSLAFHYAAGAVFIALIALVAISRLYPINV